MGAVNHPADSHDEPPGRDDATILPGDDADRTMPGGAQTDRTEVGGGASSVAPVRHERMPERIGDCRVEKRLGSGGFGDVLLAVQESDLLRRRVAIKLLKRGMDSEAVLDRFRIERKVLDTLNHPNIARLLGGGETEDGRSYLVMEFVDGLPLDLWCERQSLDVPGRLRLLKQVASALAHAHDKGIVHRDLKPANVLVGSDGVPKLLDFGIAKIITPGVAENERSHLTMPGETGPLTTAYASPEQLRGEPLSASTDIYSFGVMMYEVLAGRLPFDFSRSSFEEIRKRVCNETPPVPSVAAGNGAKTTVVTSNTPNSTRRALRGDVDNIVMMALRKEPTRRYGSMTALIADIDAHLEDRPIIARPSSVGYRLSKSIVRNRWRVALLGALLVAPLVTALWWEIERREEDRRYEEAVAQVKAFRNDANFHQNPAVALDKLAAAQALVEARIRARPDDPAAGRDLLLVLSQLCEMHENTRNIREGVAVSKRMEALARGLLERTGAPEDRQNLVAALQRRGDLLLKSGERVQAQAAFAENLQERRRMSAEKPDDLGLLQAVGVALQRQREIALDAADLAGAVRVDRELKEVRGRVMRVMRTGGTAPDSREAKEQEKAERQWMLACLFLAGDLLAVDQLQEAETEALAARDIGKARLERDRKDWRRNADLANVQEILYMIAYQRADLQVASTEVDQWVAKARASVEASSASSVALRSFVTSCVEQARVRNDLGRHAEALEAIESAIESAERFRSGTANEGKGEAVSPPVALLAMAQRCRALRGLGRLADARALVGDIQSRIAAPNEGLQWHVGRSEAACEASRCVEDPASATRLAQQAVESSALAGDKLVVAEAQLALHDALKASGKADAAAEAMQKAKAAAASSETPRAKAMLARLEPPKPAPKPAGAPASAPANKPPAAGRKRP